MQEKHPFETFLDSFIPEYANKCRKSAKLAWILETTGSADASDLMAEQNAELKLLFSDKKTYEKLVFWNKDPSLKDPKLKRQLNILLRTYTPNLISKDLIEQLSRKEAALGLLYANFRPILDGKSLSENEIRQVLKEEKDPAIRKKVWEASKQIGEKLAPSIIEIVKLRNQSAKSLGFSNYFAMELTLQEVDGPWLYKTLDELVELSEGAYGKVVGLIKEQKGDLNPWSWKEPFCQEDPLEPKDLDSLLKNVDFLQVATTLYDKMGFDITPTLEKSDMFEREGKNQHAFCINIDRGSDVRTLNNLEANTKWLETLLHEIGHAVYELEFDKSLPWLLREPPHMITTEAMALIAGRRAYLKETLAALPTYQKEHDPLIEEAEQALARRQLIFSRFVLVMTLFEKGMYEDPDQDLNALWWSLVEKYQKITPPKDREGKQDWASKYHIGLAPVYYFSYLLGELLASTIEESLLKSGESNLSSQKAGIFLKEKLFSPGNSFSWSKLIENMTGAPLNSSAWVKQFCDSSAY
jgi:peptidyl-dipeptidase A